MLKIVHVLQVDVCWRLVGPDMFKYFPSKPSDDFWVFDSSWKVNDKVAAVVSRPAKRTATSWSRRSLWSRVKPARA